MELMAFRLLMNLWPGHRRWAVWPLLALCLSAVTARAEVLFHDDFDTAALDSSRWSVGNWQLGRTMLGHTPAVSGGIASLRHDTYNPTDPGGSFLGTEIYSNAAFVRGDGIEFEARVRTAVNSPGLVTSLFAYSAQEGLSDEIDFEFLTNHVDNPHIPGERLLLSSWDDWDAASPIYNDNVHHHSTTVDLDPLILAAYNTFTLRWLPDRVEWLVNGQLVHADDHVVPDAPMPVRLNFWAPDSGWFDAYSSGLQPTADPSANVSYFYEVNSVTVRSVPEPAGLAALALFGMFALARQRIARQA